MNVFISPDFQNLLPEHSKDELEQLEKNCLDDSRHERMQPVIVWGNHQNTIIDGHHQHAIRQRHGLSIRYSVLEFDSRDEALRYALNVQLGRRNLDASQRAILCASYPRFGHGGDRKSPDQGANLTLAALAKAAGVSERTMKSAAKVADKGTAAVIEGVRRGDFAASDAAAIVDLPQQDQQQIADAAQRNGTTLKAAQLGGVSFDPAQLEKVPPSRPPMNGASVVPGKAKEDFRQGIGVVVRSIHELGIYDEFRECLSQLISRVKSIK